MDNKPSFAERIRALKAAAETVVLEAQRMEAAEHRFAPHLPHHVGIPILYA